MSRRFSIGGQDPRQRQLALLSVIMLGVLLASVFVAWLLVRHARAHGDAGARVLAEIRARGLDAFWGEQPAVQWYLVRSEEADLGWRVRFRARRVIGGFEGLHVSFDKTPAGGRLQWKTWSLTADATEGTYLADAADIVRVNSPVPTAVWRRDPKALTKIALRDGTVAAMQSVGPDSNGQVVRVESHALAPANYLPEGTMHLGMFLAARSGERTRFQSIANGLPPAGTTTRLVGMVLSGGEPTPDGYRVSLGSSGGRGFLFDKRGTLVRGPSGRGEQLAATPEQVSARFGQALDQIKQVIGDVGFRLRTPAAPAGAPGPVRQTQPHRPDTSSRHEGEFFGASVGSWVR